MSSFQPCIKWSGSKRSQAKKILEYFPRQIETYYEPFCGGASVFRALVDSDIKVKRFVLSDSNPDLMNLWRRIKEIPAMVADTYSTYWNELCRKNTVPKKREFYNSVREEYNKTFNPCLFMFLMRTCYNGMPRFNKQGKFNSPYHLNRDGINPLKLDDIIYDWHRVLNEQDVELECCDYTEINPEKGDFVYLDPPYNGTKGLYMGSFDSGKCSIGFGIWIADGLSLITASQEQKTIPSPCLKAYMMPMYILRAETPHSGGLWSQAGIPT